MHLSKRNVLIKINSIRYEYIINFKNLSCTSVTEQFGNSNWRSPSLRLYPWENYRISKCYNDPQVQVIQIVFRPGFKGGPEFRLNNSKILG